MCVVANRGKRRLAASTRKARAHARVMKKSRPGSGKRFKSLAKKVGSKKLAAWIGRKKYGKKRMSRMSAKGRKKRKR
jgi:hypothetical protein